MARPWGMPQPSRTVHCVGDIHLATSGGGISLNRQQIMAAATAKVTMPSVAATLHTGDCTTNGTTAEFALYAAFMATLSNCTPFYGVPGNHDIIAGLTAEQAAAALGFPAGPYAVDLGFVTLIGFMPGDDFTLDNSGSIFTSTHLNALDALIAAQTNPVWLFNHFPLYGTVGALADPAQAFRSIDSGFYACTPSDTADSAGILSMLAGHSNVKAWISGHTHSNLATDGFVMTVTAGSNKIAHLNTSAIASVDRASSISRYTLGPLNTVYVTSPNDDGNLLEVRYRAHDGGGYWTARTETERVTTLDLAA